MRTLNTTTNQQGEAFSLFHADQPPIFRSNTKNPPFIRQDQEQCAELIKKMISFQPELDRKLDQILEEIEDKNYSRGIGYFNSKNMVMMQYLLQLQFYQLFKINGEDLTKGQGFELYQRMAYLKTLLTKLSPVQKKLEYQKNKLLKYSDVVNVKADQQKVEKTEEQINEEAQEQENASQLQEQNENEPVKQQSDEQDELMYQPRPQALLKVKKTKKKEVQEEKYVAPKISAVLSKQDKMKRRLQIQEQRKKANLIRKYRDDLQDNEEAQQKGVDTQLAEKIKRKFRQKQSIQEQNFVRFPETKRQKLWKKKLVRSYERSNPLYDELKDIEKIKQIFTQKQDDPNIVSKMAKKRREEHKPKKGAKKRKLQ